MIVKLYDYMGYLRHSTNVTPPLPKVLVWGDRAFLRSSNKTFREVSIKVLDDTAETFTYQLGDVNE